MKALSRFALVCTLGAALAALTAACGSSDDPAPTGGAGAAGAPATTAGAAGTPAAAGAGTAGGAPVGVAATGAMLYSSTTLACNTCHGNNGEGLMGPNITLSNTAGIGTWSYAEFKDAVRNQKGKGGVPLCTFMVKFEEKYVSDQGIADIYAFLKSKPIVDTVPPAGPMYCP